MALLYFRSFLYSILPPKIGQHTFSRNERVSDCESKSEVCAFGPFACLSVCLLISGRRGSALFRHDALSFSTALFLSPEKDDELMG